MIDAQQLFNAYSIARDDLLAAREPAGHWVGALAASALSTATAVSALSLMDKHCGSQQHQKLIEGGVQWLATRQNPDGGWGDTTLSYSNIATTMLVKAALHLAGVAGSHAELLAKADAYIEELGGIAGLRRRYGVDKTFAVPILSNCALAGLVDWKDVSALPFEAAVVPQRFYRFMQLPVVSYAIPALVAIGQAKFFFDKPIAPLSWIRSAAVKPSLRVLERMQPASGGYLEATPLTCFVVMSLAATGRQEHTVAQAGARFLRDSVLADGSWPIDTDLATWNTTLAINALHSSGEDITELDCFEWLLSCQHTQRHPFTGADPGGWGWTDHSGAVPDADDTPGALIALSAWMQSADLSGNQRQRVETAALSGVRWLLGLQNRNGGWPTFCRGWGKLPFDRSGADLTAHAIRALHVWKDTLAPQLSAAKVDKAIARGFKYLERQQCTDGSWIPLWFGNQDHPEEENPVYGTAKVLLAYRDLEMTATPAAERGLEYLARSANQDGGWGGKTSSVEETSLAVEALATLRRHATPHDTVADDNISTALIGGLRWLIRAVDEEHHLESSPIGFYFAKLWYYEKLYPLTFSVSALGQASRLFPPNAQPGAAASTHDSDHQDTAAGATPLPNT